MGTRSYIAYKENNEYKYIYCHWDGYPTGVGYELLTSYNSYEKVKNLVNLGNRSSLSENPKDGLYENEPPTIGTLDDMLNELGCIEYIYVYEDGNFKVYTAHPIINEFFSYETENKIFHDIPYRIQKEILKKSIFGEQNRTAYTINKLMAYEIIETIDRLQDKPNYKDVVEEQKKMLKMVLEKNLVTEADLKSNEYDRKVFEDLAEKEIQRLKEIADKERAKIEEIHKKRYHEIDQRTTRYDMTETARVIKKELTKNKIKSRVRSKSYYGISIEVDGHNLDKANEILSKFNQQIEDYEKAFEFDDEELTYKYPLLDKYHHYHCETYNNRLTADILN